MISVKTLLVIVDHCSVKVWEVFAQQSISMCLYPMFHVSLLEPYPSRYIPNFILHPLLIPLVDEPEYEVEVILDSKVVCNKIYD